MAGYLWMQMKRITYGLINGENKNLSGYFSAALPGLTVQELGRLLQMFRAEGWIVCDHLEEIRIESFFLF
jgi:hypothetical protein